MNWMTQLEAASLNNLFREFWPDIRRKIPGQRWSGAAVMEKAVGDADVLSSEEPWFPYD